MSDRTGRVIRVGVDLAEVGRVSRLLAEHPAGVHELFTPEEIAYCRRKRDHDVHFAGRFAAKEAVLKSFGTGMGPRMRWTDVEIRNEALGKPNVRLHGEVAARARRLGLVGIDLSLSHSSGLAMAGVVTVWSEEADGSEEAKGSGESKGSGEPKGSEEGEGCAST